MARPALARQPLGWGGLSVGEGRRLHIAATTIRRPGCSDCCRVQLVSEMHCLLHGSVSHYSVLHVLYVMCPTLEVTCVHTVAALLTVYSRCVPPFWQGARILNTCAVGAAVWKT
jgi:hypothetical protein